MAGGDSQIGICNLALIAIGEPPIVSLTDTRKAAICCATLYDPVRREALRRHPWGFAKKQATLAANVTAPAFTYANAFPLPADFIRLVDEPEEDQPDYEIMNGQIYSNDDSPFQALYIFDCQDPTQFDPLFVTAFAALLAARLAQAITQDTSKENELAQKFENFKDTAALIDSQETSSREIDDDVLLRSRR